ncbi:hypothetical protein [Heyndrickxia oleronia]|jgi:hypothetical protein|uniref:hypothetical protein n=1 Tax=Heyndrickxia oleronia TaxID=38875 RepID=UPI00243162F2|nr:hypothetical protein [Heyndrickxia oleronia]MCI1590120.1 hypothetical protein [Heyndrickxia oleronia]MCI1613228.1 hypothetical protein [Heyndrickxia oleronia]MCI1744555.1 hypothetical protein [Heyndrickxia oleronia]MCI1761178.1 hypothetical protein [Heyndrickxia oleronia]
MNKYYKDKAPQWTNDTHIKHDLMIGDDSDSSLSCDLLAHITNGKWKPNYFYNFESFYQINKSDNPLIGVDMAFTKNVRCFDNHLSQQYYNSKHNPYCFNLNVYKGINADKNYYKKYPFSTLMLIMSYYDVPLPKTQLGKEIILAVDSSFIGHYATKDFFKQIHTDWLELLGFGELVEILDQRSKSYFYDLQQEYGLNEKIHINENGYLETNINFEAIQPYLDWKVDIPNEQFELLHTCHRGFIKDISQERLPDNLVSLAYTSKKSAAFTYNP